MPPKSANRSGKSTPTKGQSRGADKKREEEDQKLQEDEEARRKAEEEERLRLEQEQKEKEELARLETLEESRREQQLKWTEERLTAIKKNAETLANDKRANNVWERYMRCDGSPDPTVLTQINTFINLTKEIGKNDINVILEEAKDIYALIFELKFLLSDTPEEDITPEQESQYKETILALQELLFHRYNDGILNILKEAIYEADTESGNLQKVIRGEYEIIMLWGNLNKNPRFKSFTFESENFTFELPKPLAMAEIAKLDSVVEETGKADAEDEAIKEGGEKDGEDLDVAKSPTLDGRKSAQSQGARSNEAEEEKEGDEIGSQKGEDIGSQAIDTEDDGVDDDDLDDILDEDVIDLRQYQPIGGVFHVDLVKLPPQPKSIKGWTLRQVIDEPMTVLEYPSEAFAPKLSASRVASAKEEGRDMDSPSKLQPSEQTQPAVGLTVKLPSDVMFFEEPQVAKWDDTDLHWKTTGINDVEYDEESKTLSFKSRNFGTFCLMQDLHVNMPFQQWELRPLGQNHSLLTITAAIAEAFIEIKGIECRLQAPEDESLRAVELQHLYEKWMTPRELMIALKDAGVNIFPAEDSNKFVSVQDKEIDLEEVYDQMALLSSTYAFTWSKWNASATKKQVVLQVAPWMGHGDTRKKEAPPTDQFVAPTPPPPKLTEDDWAVFLIDEKRAHKLGISEYDDDFISKIAPGAEYHSDLLHALLETPFLGRPNLPTKDQITERAESVDKLYVYTVMGLLKASKCISYS